MKKHISYSALLSAAFLLGGCFSLESVDVKSGDTDLSRYSSSDGAYARHVTVSNYGWYLFNRWPLVCGNARTGASFPWAFFRDDVTEEIVQSRLMAHVRSVHCNAPEINIFNNERIFLEVYGIPVPIPYVLTYREIQYSAMLTRPADDERARARARLLNGEMRDLLKRLSKGAKR